MREGVLHGALLPSRTLITSALTEGIKLVQFISLDGAMLEEARVYTDTLTPLNESHREFQWANIEDYESTM